MTIKSENLFTVKEVDREIEVAEAQLRAHDAKWAPIIKQMWSESSPIGERLLDLQKRREQVVLQDPKVRRDRLRGRIYRLKKKLAWASSSKEGQPLLQQYKSDLETLSQELDKAIAEIAIEKILT